VSLNPTPHPTQWSLSPQPFAVVSALEVMKRLPPGYLVESLLMEKTVNVLVGPSGSAKTFLALSLARSIMTGTPWCGRMVMQGKVLYVCAEGKEGFPLRLRALFTHHQDNEVATAPLMSIIEDSLPLSDTDTKERLKLTIWQQNSEGPPVRLVVVDTLARCVGDFDENVSRDMTQLVKHLEEVCKATGTTVLLIHHTSKQGRTERGSGAIRCSVSSLLKIERLGGSPATFVLSGEKQKESERADKMYFSLEKVAESAVLVLAQPPADASVCGGPLTRVGDLILAELGKQGERTLSQLVDSLQLPKSTIGTVLARLLKAELVVQNKKRGPYSLP